MGGKGESRREIIGAAEGAYTLNGTIYLHVFFMFAIFEFMTLKLKLLYSYWISGNCCINLKLLYILF